MGRGIRDGASRARCAPRDHSDRAIAGTKATPYLPRQPAAGTRDRMIPEPPPPVPSPFFSTPEEHPGGEAGPQNHASHRDSPVAIEWGACPHMSRLHPPNPSARERSSVATRPTRASARDSGPCRPPKCHRARTLRVAEGVFGLEPGETSSRGAKSTQNWDAETECDQA